MSFNIQDYYKKLNEGDILLAYKGSISSDLINNVLDAVESKLKEFNEHSKVRKKIYNVLVESLQNLYHHIDDLPEDFKDQFDPRFGVLVVSKEGDRYKISTGNFIVSGKIEYSDGESAALTVEVTDSRNIVWFRKTYAETSRPVEHNGTEPEKHDTFQDLFNTIANDIAAYRNQLHPREVEQIRQTAELRYGAEMAPDVFDRYLAMDSRKRITLVHLPSPDDPMLARVRNIKARDDMLIDAINGYYEAYYRDLWEPYSNWRKFRTDEVLVMRKLEREALTQQILGVASIVGAIALGASSSYDTRVRTASLQNVMIAGGAYAVYSGTQKRAESVINKEAIEELGTSFSSEAEPLVIEVEGESIRLTGTAEQQYARWRQLLRELYIKETGLFDPAPPSDQFSPTATP